MIQDAKTSRWKIIFEDEDNEDDDIPSNPSTEPPLAKLIEMRLSRRAALKGFTAAAAAGLVTPPLLFRSPNARAAESSLTFIEVPHALPSRRVYGQRLDTLLTCSSAGETRCLKTRRSSTSIIKRPLRRNGSLVITTISWPICRFRPAPTTRTTVFYA